MEEALFSCAPAATSALMAAAELFAAALGRSRWRGEAEREEDREGMKNRGSTENQGRNGGIEEKSVAIGRSHYITSSSSNCHITGLIVKNSLQQGKIEVHKTSYKAK